MIRKRLSGAVAIWALSILAVPAARAQGIAEIPAWLAAGEEQLGQSVGEAALGGESVFVTATGKARLEGLAAGIYSVTVEDQGPTAVEAARARDAKVERLRAVAKRFSVEMALRETNYTRNQPPPAAPMTIARSGAASPPPLGAAAVSPRPFTASVVVRFARPPEPVMPAFLDALHDAGVEALPATNLPAANPFTALLAGVGGSGVEVSQATWDKASAAAVAAARQQAEVLAAAAGRRVGPARQIMLLGKNTLGDQATVMVAARFAFAP